MTKSSLALPIRTVRFSGRTRLTAYWLLNDDFLLLRVHSALGRLRRNCDHSLARGQWRRKVMERAFRSNHRHFPPVHHYPRSNLGLSGYFNHMPVLNKWIQFKIDRFRLFSLGNNREAIFLALYRLFS